jgi:adenylate kinase family enzyme
MKKRLNRIYILGTSGSGKTYLGTILSNKLKIPFYDSDDIMFIKKFSKTRTKEERKNKLSFISKNKKWIIDSRGSIWSRDPMKKSDLVIWLQPNIIIRTFRILRRYFSRRGNYEENFKSVCRVLLYSWSYRFNNKISGFKANKKFIEENNINTLVIKNNRQIKLFFKSLK